MAKKPIPIDLIDNLHGAKSKMAGTLIKRSQAASFRQKSPLVSTLMKAYKKETWKFFDKPLAIGGGTYAKEAKNTVAFGASFKGHEGNMHSPDEYIYLEDFYKDIAIYARAIYMLGNAVTVRGRYKAWAAPYLAAIQKPRFRKLGSCKDPFFAVMRRSIWKSGRAKAISFCEMALKSNPVIIWLWNAIFPSAAS
jgi:hypothetical protein